MPKIMKLTDVGSDETTVQRYINDDSYIMQQKFDGTRIQMQWSGIDRTIVWSNNGEGPVTHSAAKLKLPALEEILKPYLEVFNPGSHLTLEGELLIRTGEFVLWDLLLGNPGNDTRIWSERHWHLERFFKDFGSEHDQFTDLIKVSPTATTREEKTALWEKIKEAGVEGAVSKWINSTYIPGLRTKEWVKHKLVKSADVVVMRVERTFKMNSDVVHKGSAQLGIWGFDKPVKFTAASLIGKDLTISPGDVVEIHYLYLEPGGAPVQPRIVRKRYDARTGDGDKLPDECGLDQFPAYSREVLG